MADRLEMLMAITRNELDWLVGGNATHEEMNNSVRFFAEGGFAKWNDEQIKKTFENLIA
jgi:predicted N-acyltransferase